MKKAWIGFLAGLAIATPAALAGCNNASCTYMSKCPNDGPTDRVAEFNNTTLCNNRKNDPCCGSKYSDYVSCFESNQACTSTGVTDYTVTEGICGKQYAIWMDCYYGINSNGGNPMQTGNGCTGGGVLDAASE